MSSLMKSAVEMYVWSYNVAEFNDKLIVYLINSVQFFCSYVHAEVEVFVHGFFKTRFDMTMSPMFMVSNHIL